MPVDGQGPSRRIFRIILWSLIALLAIDAWLFTWWLMREPAGSLPEKRTRMVARHEIFAQLPPDSGAIIFLGDSHTEGFPLNEMFPGLPVVNLGVGNSTSEDLLESALISCG